ncbi:MAG: hypothetical protein ACRD2A_23965 [Vicinamibacterales bacterium]
MFLLGLLLGAAGAAWFILEDGGKGLIRLGERMRDVSRLFRDWQRSERFED